MGVPAMADQEHVSIGRKVVFLYPHSVVCADLVQAVAEQQYELYLVRDHVRLKAVLAQPEWRGALLFVNIDEALRPEERLLERGGA